MFDKNNLKAIGIELTYLGHDFHDYSKDGSPINVKTVEKYLKQAIAHGYVSKTDKNIESIANWILMYIESDDFEY